MTDRNGHTWTVEQHGTTYLLTRPGAMAWVSANELRAMKAGMEGLEYRPERKAWVRV